MAEKFNIKQGLVNVLKTALRSDNFVMSLFNTLFGQENDAKAVEYELKRAAQENTLNEMVAIHRFFKGTLNESKLGAIKDVFKAKNLMKRIGGMRGKSVEFYRKVLLRTLKKPGQLMALMYIIKAIVTLGYPIDDVIAMPVAIKFFISLLETAAEVAEEENAAGNEKEPEEQEMPINESVVANKLRRAFKHANHKTNISEAVDDRYGGRMPVNIYTGRFQPFHLGHLSNLEEAAKRGLRTVLCPVMKGSSKSAKDHPFEAVEGEMFERLKNAYGDLIVEIQPIKNPFVEFWLYPLREKGYEPIMWTTGTDRQPSYEAMIEKYKDKYGLLDGFEVVGIDKDMDAEGGSATDTGKISGTGIRKCLVDGDEEGFRRQMPKCLWDMYGKMREIMLQYAAPAQELTEDQIYELYKKRVDEAIENLVKGNKKQAI